MVNQTLDSIGLSTRDIFFIILLLLFVIAMLFSFILTALSAWRADSIPNSFESVTQSGIIVGIGRTVSTFGNTDYESQLSAMRDRAQVMRQTAAKRNEEHPGVRYSSLSSES